MPELSPKQLAIWLLIAAVILTIGARALQGGSRTTIDATALGGELDPGGESDTDGQLLIEAPADSQVDTGDGEQAWVHVHVAGAVRRPDLYRLRPESRVADAIRRAGGATSTADLDRVNLAAAVSEGQQLLVPRRGDPSVPAAPDGASPRDDQEPFSLSTATAAELETIEGIGPVTAAKILDFRDSQGGVGSVEELEAIPGIGPATMQTLRQALVP